MRYPNLFPSLYEAVFCKGSHSLVDLVEILILYHYIGGVMVSIAAFQVVNPCSISGHGSVLLRQLRQFLIYFWYVHESIGFHWHLMLSLVNAFFNVVASGYQLKCFQHKSFLINDMNIITYYGEDLLLFFFDGESKIVFYLIISIGQICLHCISVRWRYKH